MSVSSSYSTFVPMYSDIALSRSLLIRWFERYRSRILIVLTVFTSAISWWPILVEPTIDLPFWLALVCASLCTGFSILLAHKHLGHLVVASGVGTVAGIGLGFAIWPLPPDPMAGGLFPISSSRILLR